MKTTSIYAHSLNFCRLHGLKILAGTAILFIFVQFLVTIAPYHHHLTQSILSGPGGLPVWRQAQPHNCVKADGSPGEASSVQLEKQLLQEVDLEQKRSILQKRLISNSSSGDVMTNSSSEYNNTSQLELCPLVPPRLVGRLKVLTECHSFEQIEDVYGKVLEPGGRHKPPDCISRHRVAIIIPYRDREEHLRMFLQNIHPMLIRQQIDYGIFVIEQVANQKFNRAKLMNVGFKEALMQYDYQCFVFHDVDLIPEDDRNIYSCPDQPRHMSVAVDTMGYRLPYRDIFGGVSAVTKEQMEKVNGLSNEFWGWGGEDDDFSNRIRYHGFRISRYSAKIARYKMLKHKKDTPNPDRYSKLYKGNKRFKTDGLNSLKYERKDVVLKKLYTWIVVDLLPPRGILG